MPQTATELHAKRVEKIAGPLVGTGFEMPFVPRKAVEGDMALVYSTWLKSFRMSDSARNVRKTVYMASQHDVIEDLVGRSHLWVASDIEHPDQVFGWVCLEDPNTLHYAYTRQRFRQMKIASKLLRRLFPSLGKRPLLYTHHTKAMQYHKDRWLLEYNPFLVRRCP